MDNKTRLCQLNETEAGEFMMSYVIITKKNRAIVIDGGRSENMPLLKECVGKRKIAAWILTHPHSDHISGFVGEMKKNGGADFDIEKIYYNFPPESMRERTDALDYGYLIGDYDEILPEFNAVLPKFCDKTHIAECGEILKIDELEIEFLYTYRKEYEDLLLNNPMNDSSLVFKVKGEKKTAIFLGDIGPDSGDILYSDARGRLKADIVQMAHHGHMACAMEVYAAIAPEMCLWPAPDWLYNEPELPKYLKDRNTLIKNGRGRMYGVALTRKWMDILGVKEHHVTKDGYFETEI